MSVYIFPYRMHPAQQTCSQIIRAPLIFFPLVLAFLADTLVALKRISKFLTAEELATPYSIEDGSKDAVRVDGNFTWETAGVMELSKGEQKKFDRQAAKMKKTKKEPILPTAVEKDEEKDHSDSEETATLGEKPFELRELHLKIPKGSFVAIVGRVGSGKVRLR